jgi:Carboxypeptidase regulatory-like domain
MIALLFNLFASWMLALLAGASMAMAQSTVSGKVLDPHGVPVAEACVSLLNVAGSSVREATTDEQGGFALNKIGAGVYELMAQQAAIVSHSTGQTTETLAVPGDAARFERVVGVPLKSYVSLSWTYYFKK